MLATGPSFHCGYKNIVATPRWSPRSQSITWRGARAGMAGGHEGMSPGLDPETNGEEVAFGAPQVSLVRLCNKGLIVCD
jgi:hypothetical protein